MIYLVGIGLGSSADYLTLKAYRILKSADVGVYIGTMIEQEIKELFHSKQLYVGKELTIEMVKTFINKAQNNHQNLALMLPGDVPYYTGQVNEQFCLGDWVDWLTKNDIQFEVVSGISAFTALVSKLGVDVVQFSNNQNIYTTSIERLKELNKFDAEHFEMVLSTKPNLVLYQSYREWNKIKSLIDKYYDDSARIIFAYKISYPDEIIIDTNLGNSERDLADKKIDKHTLILIIS
ncbi:MAG: hypothetical protein LC115_08840 [Bacteroidia bacterium]|nr:hypothetical protein [Bacteroidia bacterium]